MYEDWDLFLPIPVVDLHGYQMIYHGLCVLRETGYEDTWSTKKKALAAWMNRKWIPVSDFLSSVCGGIHFSEFYLFPYIFILLSLFCSVL